MDCEKKEAKPRVAINISSNMFSDFLRLCIGIFMTPFLLNRLSAAVYGILPLVNSCTSFLVLASGGIQSSVGRYFTYHLSSKQDQVANKYVNTAFFLMAAILGIALIPLVLIASFFPTIFNVPPGYESRSRIVMLLLGATLYVDMLSNPFSIGFYARQRFDLRAIIGSAKQILHVLLVVALFFFVARDITMVATSTFIVTVLSSSAMLYFSKRLVPTLQFSLKLFDKAKLRDIASYSIWTLIGQVSWLLILNTDYMIINKFLGSDIVTEYSLAARWNETLRGVMMAAVAVIVPLATDLQAKGLMSEVRQLVNNSTKIVITVLMAPCLLLCIFSKELLLVWVGPAFAHVSYLFWPSIFPLIWILVELPLRYILSALGLVKWPALGGLFAALLNLLLSIMFISKFQMGAYGVCLATAISLTVYSIFYLPYSASRKIGFKMREIFVHFLPAFLAAIPMIVLTIIIKKFVAIDSWFSLGFAIAACVVAYGGSAFYVVFSAVERQKAYALILSVPLIKKLGAVFQ